MEYKIYLTDSAGTHELPPLEVPLTRVKNEKMTTVEALSGNVYDDFVATKRVWAHTWAFLSAEQYDLLDEIYERMKSEWTYPELTVEGEGVAGLVVKYELSPKNIIDNCGNVSDVTVSFRETRQLGS
jgi:hypothetical protein